MPEDDADRPADAEEDDAGDRGAPTVDPARRGREPERRRLEQEREPERDVRDRSLAHADPAGARDAEEQARGCREAAEHREHPGREQDVDRCATPAANSQSPPATTSSATGACRGGREPEHRHVRRRREVRISDGSAKWPRIGRPVVT
jgi:hypothetical protein